MGAPSYSFIVAKVGIRANARTVSPISPTNSNLIRHPHPTHTTRKILHIPSHQLPPCHLSCRQNNRIRHLEPLLPANHSRPICYRRRNRQTLEVQEKSPQNRLLILPLSSLRQPENLSSPKTANPAPILNNRIAWEFYPTRYNRYRDKEKPRPQTGAFPIKPIQPEDQDTHSATELRT